jgi:hypothetical protein
MLRAREQVVVLLAVAIGVMAFAAVSAQASGRGGSSRRVFQVKVPPAGGVTIAYEVLVVTNRVSRAGLPQRIKLKIANRKAMPKGIVTLGRGWLSKPLVGGHPAYSITVELIRPKGGRAQIAQNVVIDSFADLAVLLGGPEVVDRSVEVTRALDNLLLPGGFCEGANVSALGDVIPIAGDSHDPYIDVMAADVPGPAAQAASGLSGLQLARDAALALCRPPAPKAFYNYVGVKAPNAYPSCSGFSASGSSPADPGANYGPTIKFSCKFGTGTPNYGEGWPVTLSAVDPGGTPEPVSGGWGSDGRFDSNNRCQPSGGTVVCSQTVPGFQAGAQWVSWFETEPDGSPIPQPPGDCGQQISTVTITVSPPGQNPVTIGQARNLTITC